MLPRFPFTDDVYKMTMGVRALEHRSLFEVDVQSYHTEIALKNTLLTEEYAQYFQGPAGTEAQQWEVVALALADLARYYPDYFRLEIRGEHWRWVNQLLMQETCFTYGEQTSLPYPPLDWLGRQVQEDLLIMSGVETDGMPLIAGHLCFPSSWCLDDKMNKAFLGIHEEVPFFASTIGRSSSLLLERLKVGRPVWRVNWSIQATSRLNLLPRFLHEVRQAAHEMTAENIGERCFLRIEMQTLSRLPQTRAILFTVRTYQEAIGLVANTTSHAQRMLNVLRTVPMETLTYKGMAPYLDTLLTYLEQRAMTH